MIQIQWQILEQEGRSIKALADISQIHCKFLPMAEKDKNKQKESTARISSFQDIEKLAQSVKELGNYFGKSESEKQDIKRMLQMYKSEIKAKMKMPVLYYYQNYEVPLPRQLLSQKYQEIEEGLTKIIQIFKNRKSVFICGEQVRVIDILIYFDVCNLFYFRKSHALYPEIKQWFQAVYKIRPIRTITHQWFSMARQILRSMRARRARAKI